MVYLEWAFGRHRKFTHTRCIYVHQCFCWISQIPNIAQSAHNHPFTRISDAHATTSTKAKKKRNIKSKDPPLHQKRFQFFFEPLEQVESRLIFYRSSPPETKHHGNNTILFRWDPVTTTTMAFLPSARGDNVSVFFFVSLPWDKLFPQIIYHISRRRLRERYARRARTEIRNLRRPSVVRLMGGQLGTMSQQRNVGRHLIAFKLIHFINNDARRTCLANTTETSGFIL